MVIWLIGLSGAGKSTVGRALYALLKKRAPNTVLVDGDEIREVFRHTGEEAYTLEGRRENARRIQALCRWLDTQDINVVCPILSIFQEHRDQNRSLYSSYYEVYIETDLPALLQRDYKGLYRQALQEGRPNIVGVDLEFVPPQNPDMTIYNGQDLIAPQAAAQRILEAALELAGEGGADLSDNYPYARKELLDNPARYQMTPFIGPEFFRAWSRSRQDSLALLAQNPGLPGPAPSGPTVARLQEISLDPEGPEQQADLLALIKNFEAKGRLFRDYNPGFTSKGRRDYAEPSIYLALAKILLDLWNSQRDFVSLNAFLKCLDVLCADQDRLLSGEPEQVAALITREREIAARLSVELRISKFPAELL